MLKHKIKVLMTMLGLNVPRLCLNIRLSVDGYVEYSQSIAYNPGEVLMTMLGLNVPSLCLNLMSPAYA